MTDPTTPPTSRVSAAGRPIAALILLAVLWPGIPVLRAQEATAPEAPELLRVSVTGLHERKSSIYCSCNNIEGRDLAFSLVVENLTNRALEAYLFVWAANDEVTPPERGLWPVSAVDDALTEGGDLDVRVPEAGHRVRLRPHEELTIEEASILQPIGWADGALVRYTRLRIQAWSSDGRQLLEQPINLALLFD